MSRQRYKMKLKCTTKEKKGANGSKKSNVPVTPEPINPKANYIIATKFNGEIIASSDDFLTAKSLHRPGLQIYNQEGIMVYPIPPLYLVAGFYYVRTKWSDSKTEIAKCKDLPTAIQKCKLGYNIYDSNGNRVY